MNQYPFSSITHLMPEIRVGDEVAWNQICEKLRAGLTHKARHLLRDANMSASLSADDLVQESLVKAWKSIEGFNGKTTAQFAGWLFKIVRNTYLDWCKSSKLAATYNFAASWFEFADDNESPSKILIEEEAEYRLYACLAEISEQAQQVIMLRHFDGLKFSEIAVRLCMNPNTTASHYRRGIEELKNQLGSQGTS